jgi:hypothetical protein
MELCLCAWRLTLEGSATGACGATAGNVKRLLPPRQSRGISFVSLGSRNDHDRYFDHAAAEHERRDYRCPLTRNGLSATYTLPGLPAQTSLGYQMQAQATWVTRGSLSRRAAEATRMGVNPKPSNPAMVAVRQHLASLSPASGTHSRLKTRPRYLASASSGARGRAKDQRNSSSRALACFKSSVSKPSVNQP